MVNEEKEIKIQINSENEIKNPYFKEYDVPELKIMNNKIIICDNKEYNINDYIKLINSDSNNFLNDTIYDYCGKCKKILINIFAIFVI